MVKGDWVHGRHAFTMAWSSAKLAAAAAHQLDTTAFRYNVLVRGFDAALIAGDDRGADPLLTFTRVLGQAWEIHGEAVRREQAAVLFGGKFTTHSGISFIGEFYTPPNIPYYRDMTVSSLAGRQHYAFFHLSKNRLRERPGWKQWDLGAYAVTNLNDRSTTAVFDFNRWFGNHFPAYTHVQILQGNKTSEYGAAPYPRRIASHVGERISFLDLDQVTHFVAQDKLTFAVFDGRPHAVDQTIVELERRLDARRFLRVHRSVLVNVGWIQEVNSWFAGKVMLLLKDQQRTQLPVARDRVKDLKSRLGL